jgi:uncharacterized cupin superfamily protein
MTRRHPNVVNPDEVEWIEMGHGDKFAMKGKTLARAAGGQGLGCSYYEIAPGKRPFPYHCHFANEEAVFVLEGEGTLRIGKEEVPLRAGDYVAMPPGEEHAHQVINTSAAPLKHLCMSTMISPEVVKYPDSNKLAASAGRRPNFTLRAIFPLGAAVDYWDGE